MYTKSWLEIMKGRDQQLGRPQHRWDDKITMVLREIGLEGMDLIVWLRI
jgi:hypothetical protein